MLKSFQTVWGMLKRIRPNLLMMTGLAMLLFVFLLAYVGPWFVNPKDGMTGAVPPRLRPSKDHLLGSDTQGRDLLTVIVLATGQTLKVGLIAGVVGLGVGVLLGLISGYFGGALDTVICTATDVLMTIPGIAILILIAANTRTISLETMALIVASQAWMGPTRTIRSQTLSLRERAYIEVAKLNGVGGLELVITEILPNLLPYIAAGFAMAVSHAILGSIGLEVMGLGPQNESTLGMTIYWARFYNAILRGMWWWWGPPIALIILIFSGLLFTATGLDQLVNVRMRRQA